MLPLLLYEMSERADLPIPLDSSTGLGGGALPSTVRQLSNDVEADRDYNTGVKNVESQSAHAVSAKASVLLGGNEGEIWDCKTSDGYMCNCKRRNGAQDVRRARQIPSWATGGGKRRKLKAEEKEKAKGKRKADRALARPLDRARDVREAKAAAAAAAAAKKGT